MIAVRQVVTVNIDIIELVVEAYRLGLLIGLQQRPLVPQADVLDRVFIPCQHRGRQVSQRRVGSFLDGVELVGLASKRDVVLQIGGLERQLARLHKELLKDDREHEDADDIEGDKDPRSHEQRAKRGRKKLSDEQRTRRRRDGDHDPQCDPRHVISRVAGTMYDAKSGVDEVIVIEVEPKSPVGNQNKQKHGEMRRGIPPLP